MMAACFRQRTTVGFLAGRAAVERASVGGLGCQTIGWHPAQWVATAYDCDFRIIVHTGSQRRCSYGKAFTKCICGVTGREGGLGGMTSGQGPRFGNGEIEWDAMLEGQENHYCVS